MRPLAVAALPAGFDGGAKSSFQRGRRNWMFGRRLAAVTSAAVLALGGTVIAATPAHASDPNCQTWVGASYQAGSHVSGYKFKECVNGTEIPLYVTVERYLAPGTWQVEA